MPPIRSARNRKPPPDGFDDIEDTLLEFSNKMKDAENASHEGKKRHEVLWPIFQISHQRSRYIYDLYYEKEAISKQLYDWLLRNNYAEANLIAKWKKQGYEKTKETNFSSTCICRVPKAQLKEEQNIQCVSCGCRGCASSD
ncbi:Component of the SF3b subcomplex of the U2 snRNP [Ophidiomyces ophidiicola]|uniref:Component of the SF3b subcomplex of the U2 snRNP n=1 Tax=Ophidiomyces ophidiicola TaxID=1387563 RepID=A0ACB8URU8_9EURO|nr:Component of the SF3b subcomplex of the U2 snRNP [Ophidiomyces ophidiicola]KAI1969012.1 Component of the SF3b subcomplex of the U2 snRNP [Ophidiomyces ophidiicola]KAI1970887.1 Component of the SF3b subcomplex of the U2 snRNP [Ophidiomyces ophidiicola]KAI2002799.1 Component of the SF3b subcomplex of the U2 snRNP [Ophidiomyces ophidiicola]KAI2019719.1 Component of the SF3b subcomplex of the U2 snRNP [Ophidiomyces ophidiicola]